MMNPNNPNGILITLTEWRRIFCAADILRNVMFSCVRDLGLHQVPDCNVVTPACLKLNLGTAVGSLTPSWV